MKIIDAHAHLLAGGEGFAEIVESDLYESIWLMDLSGIELQGYNLASQREVLQAARDFRGRVYAFGFLDFNADVSEIDRLKELGFVGLKPYKPNYPWSDERHYAHYARACELGLPILFHTGLAAPGPRQAGHAAGSENMRPGYLAGVAEAFPELTILGGHLGWPWIEETEQNLYYYKNIRHDLSGYRRSIGRLPELLDRRCHDGTDRFFNDKMLFSSDSFYGSPWQNEQSRKLRTFWTHWFELIGEYYYRWGAPEEREKVFYGNAKQIQETWE